MSISRTRARNDTSNGDTANGARVSSGGPSTTVLVSATRNRKHPPLVEHVNNCPECLVWVMDYMSNVAKTIERRFR